MSSPKFFRKEEIADKIVIEATGKKLGKAKEIGFSLDGSAALFVAKDDGSEMEIPMSRINGVADFIIIRVEAPPPRPAPVQKPPQPKPAPPATMIPPPPAAPAPAQPMMATACKNCGAPLKPGAKFCTKCGASAV